MAAQMIDLGLIYRLKLIADSRKRLSVCGRAPLADLVTFGNMGDDVFDFVLVRASTVRGRSANLHVFDGLVLHAVNRGISPSICIHRCIGDHCHAF